VLIIVAPADSWQVYTELERKARFPLSRERPSLDFLFALSDEFDLLLPASENLMFVADAGLGRVRFSPLTEAAYTKLKRKVQSLGNG